MKICSTCQKNLSLDDFYYNGYKKSGEPKYRSQCKKCISELRKKTHHSKQGLIQIMYSKQLYRQHLRFNLKLDYSLEDLRNWAFKQDNFDLLFQNWERSSFKKDEVPSCDRIDATKPYSLDNLQLLTWEQNFEKSHQERQRPVRCIETGEVFESSTAACLSLGLVRTAIDSAITKGGTSGGYHWEKITIEEYKGLNNG